MRSPVIALAWEIGWRQRKTAWLVIFTILAGWLVHLALPENSRTMAASRERALTATGLMLAASIFLVFGIFNHTEYNRQRAWTGFPYRLFSLPVPTWLLVALPMLLGVASVEAVFLAWVKLVFVRGELVKPGWFAVLIGTYMVFYQTILWSLAGFRAWRIVALGLVGTSFVGVACLPFSVQTRPSPWVSENVLSALLAGLAMAAFITAWLCVARQRRGGGRGRNWFRAMLFKIGAVLPRRRRGFEGPSAAQFWYEWRQAGFLLPLCVAALLVLVIGPISWYLRDDPVGSVWVLGWTLAMPVILAVPVGKGFSKPEFWSGNLLLPAFVGIRPITTGDLVVARLRVAALSAGASWALVLLFLLIWLPLWADMRAVAMIRVGYWMAYSHSIVPQYFIAALSIVAGALLTWKFLVGGLWVGLSGDRRLFIGSAVVYSVGALVGMIGFAILLDHDEAFRGWLHRDPNRLLAIFEWLAALGVLAKFWMAARSWRGIAPKRVRGYLLLWMVATAGLVALAMLLWAGGALALSLMAVLDFWPVDPLRLKNLLLLLALLAIPFGRLGLAPTALAKNRRAGPASKADAAQ